MKTDTQLKTDVTEELRWTPNVTSSDIEVAAHHGVVTLTGSVPHFAEKLAAEQAIRRVAGVKAIAEELTVDLTTPHKHKDADIAQSVVASLGWHVWVPNDIQATVENGWVTLSGHAKWDFERQSAADALRYLSGVKGVYNNIVLTPGVDPTKVRDTIESTLKRDAELDAKNVVVTTEGGRVVLSGTVRSWNERDEAGTAAWSTAGVTYVENNIEVYSLLS